MGAWPSGPSRMWVGRGHRGALNIRSTSPNGSRVDRGLPLSRDATLRPRCCAMLTPASDCRWSTSYFEHAFGVEGG